MSIERYRATWDGEEVFLHRCPTCWNAGPHAAENNGFIRQTERIVHASHCPEAKPLPVVQPSGDASEDVRRAFGRLVPGSVAVAKRRASGVWVYYEGGIYSRQGRAATEEERLEYARIAAGRAAEQYPTVAFFVLPTMDGLEVVGEVDVQSRPFEVKFVATGR